MPNGGLQTFGVALVVENLPAYKQAADSVTEAQNQMGSSADRAAESAGHLDLAYAAAGATLALMSRRVMGTLQSWVMTAARAQELDEALVLMANTIGKTREEIMAIRQAVIDLGVTQSGANQVLMTAIQSNLSFEDTLRLVRRAQELAVPAGRDSTTTAIDLMYAITSGNVVLLRKYGILVSLRQEMARTDQATKKSIGELDSASRSQMMYNAVMRESEVYVGAYERAMEFASKQMRSWPRYIEEIHRSFGEHLLPVLGFVVDKINILLKGLVDLPDEVKAGTMYVLAFTAAVTGLAGAVALLNTQFAGRFMVALKALPGLLIGLPKMIIAGLVSPWGLALTAIGGFAAAVIFDIGDMQKHFVATFQRMRVAVEAFGVAVRQIVGAITATWQALNTNFQVIADTMYTVFVQTTAEMNRAGEVLTKRNFGIEFDPYRFAEGAASLMIGFAEGLVRGLIAIMPVITSVLNTIASFFGGSLPERGPLANIVTAGADIIRGYLRGMGSASLEEVTNIAERMGEALEIPIFEASEAIRQFQLALRDLDDVLVPIETQIRKIEAAASTITIPLQREMRELQLEVGELDDLLRPLEVEMRKLEAAASIVAIPLQQQVREMDKIIGQLEEQERLEEEMAGLYLENLQRELGLLEEVIDADQARLNTVQLQIGLEQRRLRESGKFDSQHLRSLMEQQSALRQGLITQAARTEELEAEAELAEAVVDHVKRTESAELALYREERAALESIIAAESERVTYAREALALAQARQVEQRIAFEDEQAGLQALVDAENERIQFAREELELARALQVEQRIALETEMTAWQRRQEELQYYMSLAQQIAALVKPEAAEREKAAKKAKDLADQMDRVLQSVGDIEDKAKGGILDPARIEEMKRRIAEMMKPLLEEQLPQLKVEWDNLTKAWERMVIAIEVKFDFPDLATVRETFLTLFGTDLPTAIGERLFGPKFTEELTERGLTFKKEGYTWGEIAAKAYNESFLANIDWRQLQTEAVAAFGAVGLAIKGIDWQQVQAGAAVALGTVLAELEKLRLMLVSRLPEALALLEGAWGIVSAMFAIVAETILPPLQEAFTVIGVAIQQNLGPMLEALRELLVALMPALAAIGAVLGVALVAAIGVVTSAVGALAKGIATAFPFIMRAVTGAIEVITGTLNLFVSIVEWIVAAISGDTTKMAASWEKMKDSVVKIVEGLWETVKNVFTAAGALLSGIIRGFVETIVSFFQNLYNRLVGRSVLWDLYNAAIAIFTQLKDLAISIFTTLRDMVWAKALELKEWVIATFNELLAILSSILDDILSYATTTWETLKTEVTTIADNLLAALSATLDSILAYASTTWETIKTEVTTKASEILAAVSTIFTDMKSAIETKLSEILTAIGTFLSDIVKKLGAADFLETMKDMGKTIFQSLWDGLKEKAGKILKWIKGIAGGWISSIKGKFGIVGDPYSTVFQGIGESLGEGLKMGIANLQPVLQAQVQALVATVPSRQAVPALSRGALGGNTYSTSSGDTYNLTAQYSRVQSPASIRDDLGLMKMIGV